MGTSDNTNVSNLVVITSCISFVLVCFYYLMSCDLCRFHVLVMIVCGQMKSTFAPNLGRRAAHLGGTVLRLLDKIYSSSSGVEPSRFLNSSVLSYFKPVNASEWDLRSKNIGAPLCYRKGGAKMGAEQLYLTFWTF